MNRYLDDRHRISEAFGGDRILEFGFRPKDGTTIIQLWGKVGN